MLVPFWVRPRAEERDDTFHAARQSGPAGWRRHQTPCVRLRLRGSLARNLVREDNP